jgi:hypothetical protein
MATPANKKLAPDVKTVYDDIRYRMNITDDSTELKAFNEARNKAMTDDQERFNILRGIVGADEEGTLQMPLDTTQAKLYNDWPVREEQLEIPTTKNVLEALGYKDIKDKKGNVTTTAQQAFIADYLNKPKRMTTELEKAKKGFGTYSGEILKRAFRESLKDEQERQTQLARDEALNPSFGDDPRGWFASKVFDLLGSNQKAAYARGEEPGVGDYLADYGGNALMLVPGAGYVKALKMAGRIPKVGNVLTNGATWVANKVPRVASVAEGVVGNSVAPVGTEALKFAGDAVDDDRDAQYNIYNAAIGALTNYGVNDLLIRKASMLNRMLFDNKAGREATKETREALKGAASDAIKAKDVLQAYVVNKLGDGTAANYAANVLRINPDTMKDIYADSERIENARYPKKTVDTTGLNEVDLMYLQRIIDDPDYINNSNDTDFKMWFATRGNELLRGTDDHVPTMEVKY